MEQRPLYWKEVDEPYSYIDKITGKLVEGIVIKRMASDYPKVDKIWETGSYYAGKMACYLHITSVDGKRFEKRVEPEQIKSLDIPEAIEFIQSL